MNSSTPASIVPDLWITTHASDLFRNLNMSGVSLLNVHFLQLVKHPTDYRFVGGTTKRERADYGATPIKNTERKMTTTMETRMDDIDPAVKVVGIHISSIIKQFLAIIAAASVLMVSDWFWQNKTKKARDNRTGKHEHNARLHEGTKIRCHFSLTIQTNPALTQPENQSVKTLQGRLQAERRH